mgnify:CR=1 FL=1
MVQPFLRAYSELLVRTCHRRGAHAMGGMAAQIPINNDEAANEQALARVRADKLREVTAGHDGTWVAHPALIPVAREIFDAHMAEANQLHVARDDAAMARIAEAHPENDYFGLEVHVPGVGALCKLIAEKNLTNLRIGNHDAVEVVRDMLPEGSLSGIHVFFPDPWHKKKHNKRRLIQPEFVARLVTRLAPGGYLH